MIDPTLVTSGFDTETLLSERYVAYVLLAQIEAGLLSPRVRIVRPAEPPDDPGLDLDVTIHPPTAYERLYEPHPGGELPDARAGAFEVDILFDHPSGADVRIGLFVTVVDNRTGRRLEGGLDLFTTLSLGFQRDGALEKNHRLALEVVDIGGIVVNLAESFGADRDELLESIKAAVDRSVPFGVGEGTVQRVVLRTLRGSGGTRNALGLYVNLALRAGPEPDAFLGERGDADAGQNFLATGRDLAFATSPGLYAALGSDAHARTAVKREGGGFHFPIRTDPDDPDSEIGRIKRIDVGPELRTGPDGQAVPAGGLTIDIHGEYTDSTFDPDFHFLVFLRPRIEDGLLGWDVDTAFESGPAGVVAALLGGVILGVLTLNLAAGAGAFVAIMLELQLVVEPLLARMLADEVGSDDLSFLDALPHRITAATRRWDPLYETRHQVVGLLDDVRIDFDGIAFEGRRAILGKEPRPVRGGILRDEERDAAGAVTHLRYRVTDFAEHEADYEALAPGTDRRSFRRADPAAEPTLVSLTLEQIDERSVPDRADAPGRVLAPVALVPRRVHTPRGQIDHILCISRREIGEERSRLIDEFRARTRPEIEATEGERVRTEVAVELEEELGRPPTDRELADAVEARFEELVDEAQSAFEADELPGLLSEAMDALLRLDMAPEEFAALQSSGILVIEGKEIVVREGTPYYRDRPDRDTTDNLLALPRYRPPFRPAGSDADGGTDTADPTDSTDSTTTTSDGAAPRATAVGSTRR
jgi:hypothetical protein